MKNLKITIIGNSVAIRNRPPEKYPHNKNYGALLGEELSDKYPDLHVTVSNMSFSRATIMNIVQKYDDYFATMPDYFIINLGVSDASTREIPYWYAELINKKGHNLIRSVFSAIHTYCIKPKRRFFVLLRGKRSWISQKKFRKYFNELIIMMKKETNAKIIAIPINPANARVENAIPGSRVKYIEYNKIMEQIILKNEGVFVKFDDLVQKVHYPDGIHYSLQGNQFVTKKLFSIIEKDISNA
ncbi:MAG: hypothetical protein K9N07_04465 [Candidatus Cloacimonetes bacterium]|nr:hypothetical protein [Candidatus Cloacimonadota bacterium]